MKTRPRFYWLLAVLLTLLAAGLLHNRPTSAQAPATEPFFVYFVDTSSATIHAFDTQNPGSERSYDISGLGPFDPTAVVVSPDGDQAATCVITAENRFSLRVFQLEPEVRLRFSIDAGAGMQPDCSMQPPAWATDGDSVVFVVQRYALYEQLFAGVDVSGLGPAFDVFVMDTTTGEFIHSTAAAGLDISDGTWGGAEVVRYVPDEYVQLFLRGYEGPGRTVQWNLGSGDVNTLPDGFDVSAYLPSTGEVVYPAVDPAFPQRTILGLGDVPLNTVQLGRLNTPTADTRAIYTTAPRPDHLLYRTYFVDNGRAVLITTSDGSLSLDRTGNRSRLDVSFGTLRIVGTPTGFAWVQRVDDTMRLLHRASDSPGDTILFAVADPGRAWQFAGSSALLGAQNLPPFSTTLDDIALQQSTAVACAAINPPPLLENGDAVVVDDVPNNVRRAPSVAAEVVGQFAPGETVQVLSGPVCVDGFAWYEVTSETTFGWTVEGGSGVYWLQNISPAG